MQHLPGWTIESLQGNEFDSFVNYLNEHVSSNGSLSEGYFQPIPRASSFLSPERAAAFRAGLDISVGDLGWRRAWVLRDSSGHIGGHVDLRSHPDEHARHRCLLGIGVRQYLRRKGGGTSLIQFAASWAVGMKTIKWIDLQTIGTNSAAIALYRKLGFTIVGDIDDMFNLDGQSFPYVLMTMRLDSSG